MRQLLVIAALAATAVQADAQTIGVHVGAGLAPGREGTHVLGALSIAPARTLSARADILVESGSRSVAAALANVVYTRTLFSRSVYAVVGAGVNLDHGWPLAGAAGAGVHLRDTGLPLALEGRFFAAPDEHLLLTLALRL
ncbi:MAG: hypothetical protein ACREOK_15270 [Gemmatimonadaceae bacterium]